MHGGGHNERASKKLLGRIIHGKDVSVVGTVLPIIISYTLIADNYI